VRGVWEVVNLNCCKRSKLTQEYCSHKVTLTSVIAVLFNTSVVDSVENSGMQVQRHKVMIKK